MEDHPHLSTFHVEADRSDKLPSNKAAPKRMQTYY